MQKYKSINTKTKKETLCEKVTINGFDYYVQEQSNGDYLLSNEFYVDLEKFKLCQQNSTESMMWMGHNLKRVIATNNPNIDIPQVVDELDYSKLSEAKKMWQKGYNKSQELYPFSEEDMIEFYEWCDCSEESALFWKKNRVYPDMTGNHYKQIRENRKKLLQLWKEGQPKIIYYE